MEDFKIEHFKKDNPNSDFPEFSTVDGEQLGKQFESSFQLKQLVEESNSFSDDCQQDQFNLAPVFEKVGVSLDSSVYLSWELLWPNGWKSIDQMKAGEFAKHFEDIWYPSSDDLLVFDQSCNWYVLIMHYGYVGYGVKK